jgi:hypothetical protein
MEQFSVQSKFDFLNCSKQPKTVHAMIVTYFVVFLARRCPCKFESDQGLRRHENLFHGATATMRKTRLDPSTRQSPPQPAMKSSPSPAQSSQQSFERNRSSILPSSPREPSPFRSETFQIGSITIAPVPLKETASSGPPALRRSVTPQNAGKCISPDITDPVHAHTNGNTQRQRATAKTDTGASGGSASSLKFECGHCGLMFATLLDLR